MRYIGKIVDVAVWCSTVMACLVMVAMTVLITLEVILRPLGQSLLLTEEYSGYMVLAVLGFGAAMAIRQNRLLRVEFLLNHLGPKTHRVIFVIYALLGLGFCAILTYRLGLFAITSFERGTFAPTPMGTPLFLPQSLIPIGLLLACIVALQRVFSPPSKAAEHRDGDSDTSAGA